MATARKIAISTNYTVKITKWHVSPGQDVKKDCIIASYVYCNETSTNFITEKKLKSKFDGKVSKVLVGLDIEVPQGAPVISIIEEQCKHTIVMKDMCCECGADLRKKDGIPGELAEPTPAAVSMIHNIPELRVSVEEATQLAKNDEKQLLKARKLALVVDLDQTLIHTTHEKLTGNHQDVFHFHLPDQPFEYHTKVRPGAKQFLDTISKMYELHIFTMGSRLYAHTIARHLDPDEKLFAHRIRSRDECLDGFSKSRDLRALFPCGDHMVCIIDDREDIWNFAPNLVTVKPYRYFVGTGDINEPFSRKQTVNFEGRSNTNSNSQIDQPMETTSDNNSKSNQQHSESAEKSENFGDEDLKEQTDTTSEFSPVNENVNAKEVNSGPDDLPTDATIEKKPNAEPGAGHSHDLDDYLFYLEEILERIHRSFYSALDEIKLKGGLTKQDNSITRFCTPGTINPDTRSIIPSLRQQTLRGASIVFTGVIPTNVPLEKSVPYRIALGLGARVTNDLVLKKAIDKNIKSEQCSTHVIAARLGTQKAYRAGRTRHIKLVNPEWLWCCAQRWEWVEECLFPVPNVDSSNGVGTPEVSSKDIISTDKIDCSKSGGNNGISPLAKDTGEVRINKSTTVDSLEDIHVTTFSRDELEEMDKEVEEYMLSDKDDDDNDDHDGDCLGSVSGSSSRQSERSGADSRLSSSSQSSSKSNSIVKKRKSDDNLNMDNPEIEKDTKKSRLVNRVAIPTYGKIDNTRDGSDSDNSSDDDESYSEEDLQIGALLERQISDD